MVVDTTAAAGEDVIFVQLGDETTVAWVDEYLGWGDGAALRSWHFIILFFAYILRVTSRCIL